MSLFRHDLLIMEIRVPSNKNETSLKTELRFGDKKIVSPIEEGQILTFPSFVSHRSPVNQTTDCKIIISFNTSINMKL